MASSERVSGSDAEVGARRRGGLSLIVVTNRRAGGMKRLEPAIGRLRQGADEFVAVDTADPRFDVALREAGGRTVVVAGGDGTLHVVVQELWRSGVLADTVLGLLPLGTGNDMARSARIPLDPASAVDVVLSGSARALDLLVDDRGSITVNAVHYGVGGLAVRHADPLKPLLGRLAYRIGAAWAGATAPGWPVRVEVDSTPVFDGTALFIGIGNGRTIGGGSVLWPEALPDDGRADVVVVAAGGVLSRLRLARALRSGDPDRAKGIVTGRGESIRVCGPPLPCVADGETCGAPESPTWTVRPGSWRLLAPPEGLT